MPPSPSPKKRSRSKSRRTRSSGGRQVSFADSIDINDMALQLCHMQHYMYWLKSLGSRNDIQSSGNIDMHHLQKVIDNVITVFEEIIPTYDLSNLEGPEKSKDGSPMSWIDFLPPDMKELFGVIPTEEMTEEQKTQVKCYQIQKAVSKVVAKIKRRANYIVYRCVKDGKILGSEKWQDSKTTNELVLEVLHEFIDWASSHPEPSVSLVGKTEDGKKKLITFRSSAKHIEGAKVSKTKTTRTSSITRYDK